jgi:serine/threonine-protein kinase
VVGTTISHYKIIEKIGQGGMGEVYRAEDTNLSREVAIKVLPEQFTKDPQRLARFEREAKLLASLNHPNIAAIYGLEEADGVRFLSLELVEGETLAERVAKGPVPVDEAFDLCRQIAEGVEAAHEKGVIHRDLKPPNVKLTPEGKIKILDFGLAKAFEEETPVTDIPQSPTLTEEMTRAGVILGTAAYMSPEQAKGKPVDKRADVFAFGAVLYELLTGKRAFEGETIAETIAAVLKSEPDLEKLPSDTPWRIKELLEDCLQKNPQERPHDISHAWLQVKKALKEPVTALPMSDEGAARAAHWKRGIAWSLTGLTILIAALILWNLRTTAPTTSTSTPPVVRSLVALPDDLRIADLSRGVVALSPDGTHLAYAATRDGTTMLFLRAMDQLEAQPITGTEDGSFPFFSPDGQWLGFFADAKLKKVLVSGGASVILSDVPSAYSSASWGVPETIVLTPFSNSILFQVSAEGGTLQPLTTLDSANSENTHVLPQILPDTRRVLFTVVSPRNSQIVVQSLETKERRVVLEGVTGARYVPTGHLVYPQEGTLMAVAFDVEQLEVKGSPIPILQGVIEAGPPSLLPHFAFSDTGTLVYLSTDTDPDQGRTLVWVDRGGAEEPLEVPPRSYSFPRLSSDGQKVVTNTDWNDINSNLSVYDIRRDAWTQLTFEGGRFPVWTPDGKRIVFGSHRFGPQDMFWKPADGTGAAERLSESALNHTPHSLSPDGKSLAFSELHPTSSGDIWVLPLEGERTPWPFLQTPSNETGVVFSPDGHWVAYRSNESSRQEIYVQPFPSTGAKWLISTEGGEEAAWARSGEELFYRNGDQMMAVDITTEPTFTHGNPKLLFEGPYVKAGFSSAYDVTPDAQRFLMIKESEQQLAVTELNVVLNWFEELKRLVPTN